MLPCVRLGDEQFLDVDADALGEGGVQGVLHIDVGGLATAALGLGDDVLGERGLAGALWAIDLDDSTVGKSRPAERQV